jgi:hypothetical protein
VSRAVTILIATDVIGINRGESRQASGFSWPVFFQVLSGSMLACRLQHAEPRL